MELNKFRIDSGKSEKGVWVDVDDGRLLIARMFNPQWSKTIKELTEQHRGVDGKKELSDEENAKIINQTMSETILLGWEGLTFNGKEYPYSKENCLELLSNKEFTEFREYVWKMASDIENYRVEDIKNTGKG